jgi:hypothetical protein
MIERDKPIKVEKAVRCIGCPENNSCPLIRVENQNPQTFGTLQATGELITGQIKLGGPIHSVDIHCCNQNIDQFHREGYSVVEWRT